MEENRDKGIPGSCRNWVPGSCPGVEALLSLEKPLRAEGKGAKIRRWLLLFLLLHLPWATDVSKLSWAPMGHSSSGSICRTKLAAQV